MSRHETLTKRVRWKIVLAGDIGAGKSTICNGLLSLENDVQKTQSPVFHGDLIIDVPGEFLMHPHLRRNFLAVAQDAETIVYVQSVQGHHLGIPPGFLQVRPHQRVVGVINKVDLPGADVNKAEMILELYGIERPYYTLSAIDREQMKNFLEWLKDKKIL